jgi:peptide/nickel transport system substrate-binding protein
MNHQITDIDAQSKIMREAKTDAEKQAALDKIQDIWRAQVPSVITGATPERIVWRKTVHGVTPNVASTILWHNVWME